MALGAAADLEEGRHPAGSAALLARGRIGAMLERDGGEVVCPPRFLGGSASQVDVLKVLLQVLKSSLGSWH